MPKWNPLVPTTDLCDELKLTPDELNVNQEDIEIDKAMTYDTNFRLTSADDGFRIFAMGESMNEISARRQHHRPRDLAPEAITAFIHIKVLQAGQHDPKILTRFKLLSEKSRKDETVYLTFDDPTIRRNFRSGILGATLALLQKIPKNIPLLICCSSDFLLKTLIKDRRKSENHMLDPCFPLLKAVFAALNERVARTQFKQMTNPFPVTLGPEKCPPLEVDTEIDSTFNCPGMLISQGSQRIFTKIIKSWKTAPLRKATFINLDRIRCSVNEISGWTPTDETIWKSIRSTNLRRLHRELFWKSIHNIFRVGDFWTHIDDLEILGQCHTCGVPESLEHIAMECEASGAKLIWQLTEKLWRMKYDMWPSLNWGLILGCNLVKFKHINSKISPVMGRLYAVLVSTAWHTIWNVRNDKVLKNPDRCITDIEIHNRWLKSVNSALGRDRILTNKLKFGDLALNKDLVLRTWSGLLMNEDSLPDDWTYTAGVLVGIQPLRMNGSRNGIG
jgi:hypothetical protein